MAIELQITQEYLGQQRHVCYTAPMWKEVLDFDMQAKGAGTPVKQLVAGKTFGRPTGGFVGVSNVGRDTNWLGHHLAMANLYAFGRLAWNPDLSSKADRRRMDAPHVRQRSERSFADIVDILMRSWPIYESYTGPLGIGTLTDIIHIHFGPAPESSEYNGWGQWHRANETGVGMDRTVATGTRFIGQYRPPVAAAFESLDSCPDDLLLFMHHVPYTHRLHSGETVIQHFYDSHYQGGEEAAGLVDKWRTLERSIDQQRYREVLDRLEFQAGHAQVWRDSICRWFMKRSGIPDEKGRVGNYPGRIEAEDQQLDGYEFTKIEPWEAASGRGAVQLGDKARRRAPCVSNFTGRPGQYDLRVQYLRRRRRRFKVQAVRCRPCDRPMASRQSLAHADDVAGCPFVDPTHDSQCGLTIRATKFASKALPMAANVRPSITSNSSPAGAHPPLKERPHRRRSQLRHSFSVKTTPAIHFPVKLKLVFACLLALVAVKEDRSMGLRAGFPFLDCIAAAVLAPVLGTNNSPGQLACDEIDG